MKTSMHNWFVLIFFLCIGFSFSSLNAQEKKSDVQKSADSESMSTYVIEREIPEIGQSTSADLKTISQKSCSVLDKMSAEDIQWVHSYVAENKIYCIYKATNQEILKEHAEKGGFPINSISQVSEVISPATADN